MKFTENVHEDVWQTLGPQKYMLGRRRVRKIVERAISKWPGVQLSSARDENETKSLTRQLANTVAADEFGSIMLIIFIGLVTTAVRLLLEWWLLSSDSRMAFLQWKHGLNK